MRLLVIGPQAFADFVAHPGVAKAMATQLAHRLRRIETVGDADAAHDAIEAEIARQINGSA
jgi:CRP-like cAMP-binding protein